MNRRTFLSALVIVGTIAASRWLASLESECRECIASIQFDDLDCVDIPRHGKWLKPARIGDVQVIDGIAYQCTNSSWSFIIAGSPLVEP